MESNYSAQQALSDAEAARTATAARIPSAWWYHGLVGLGEGACVAAIAAVRPVAFQLALTMGGMMLVLWASSMYKNRQGVWPSFRGGSRPMRIAWITYAAGIAVMLLGALVLRLGNADPALGWFLAAWTALTVLGLGFAFDAQVRKDIRGGRR